MSPDSAWSIDGVLEEYRRLKEKIKDKETLNAMEEDDLPILEEYINEYNSEYLDLDFEKIRLYEIWRDFLSDQRTYSGTLLNSEIFTTLTTVYPYGLTRGEVVRHTKTIKKIDGIFKELWAPKSAPPDPDKGD